MSRLGSRGASSRMRVRFKRAWRGYRAGDVITPPAALREELLRVKTPLGDPVAELVDVPAAAGEIQAGGTVPAPVQGGLVPDAVFVDEIAEQIRGKRKKK